MGQKPNVLIHSTTLFSGLVIPTKEKSGGSVVGGIIEAIFTSVDIFRYYLMMKDGTIDEDEFIELVCKHLLVTLTSVAGAELCRIAGFAVAGRVGKFIGGLLGKIFGGLVGKVMAEVVLFGKDVVMALLERYGGSYLYSDTVNDLMKLHVHEKTGIIHKVFSVIFMLTTLLNSPIT